MSSEPSLLKLYGQSFEGVPVGEGGVGVGEEARLRATPVGAYEFSFRQVPRYEFAGAVFFNGAGPEGHDGRKQFEAVEDISGTERTLTIQRTGGDIPFESLEVIPLDWREAPLDFTQLEAGDGRRTIGYAGSPPPEALKIRISGLNVFEVESVTACVWAAGREETRFHEPQAAFIRRTEAIRVDALDNPRGEARSLEEHLRALLNVLFDMAGGRGFEFDCRYQYELGEGGLTADVPVLVIEPHRSGDDGEIHSALATYISRWYQEMSPKKGTFAFGMKVFGVRSPRPAPVLHLSQLLLPPESIAGLD